MICARSSSISCRSRSPRITTPAPKSWWWATGCPPSSSGPPSSTSSCMPSRIARSPSTAQIMDPAKRIGSLREDPLAVNLPDLAGLLPGGTLVSEDEVGEFGLGAVIALHLGEIEGRRAAVGWRGDRFQVWEDAAGHFLIACLVVMRDEQMAATLSGHLRDFVARRHPGLAAKMRAGG